MEGSPKESRSMDKLRRWEIKEENVNLDLLNNMSIKNKHMNED